MKRIWQKSGVLGAIVASIAVAAACTPETPLSRNVTPVSATKKNPTPKPSASSSSTPEPTGSTSASPSASGSPSASPSGASPSPSSSASTAPIALPKKNPVTTYAGSNIAGLTEGAARDARFSAPASLATFAQNLYVADQVNNRIRKITATGTVSTYAGATTAFGPITAVTVDPKDGTLYVAEHFKVHKVGTDGVVSLLAGGSVGDLVDKAGAEARFKGISCLAVDSTGAVLVGDSGNFRIRKITKAGEVSTLAGGTSGLADGNGSLAGFQKFGGFAVDAQDTLYFTDGNRVRRMTKTNDVSTLAGKEAAGFTEGKGADAQFNEPSGIARTSGGHLMVADTKNNRIRIVTIDAGGQVTVGTQAGQATEGYDDGEAASAKFKGLAGLAIDATDSLFIADRSNFVIRRIELK